MNLNNYFDKIYLINLDRQPHRLGKIWFKLKSLNIDFHRISAVDGALMDDVNLRVENKFVLACLLSHIKVIKHAKENSYNKILIFEDDVMFCENFSILIQEINKIPLSWKLLYLGASQYDWDDLEFFDNFYFSKETLGTFAYGVDSFIFDEIISICEQQNAPIDRKLAIIQKKYYKECYTFYPNLCVADISDSSIRPPRNFSTHSPWVRWNLYNYI